MTASATWLGVMENVLRHNGYAGRTLVAACIALQAVATILFIGLNGRAAVLRALVALGGMGVALFGASAVMRILHAAHFEGFVLVIGLALVVEGICTVAMLYGSRPSVLQS